MSRLKTVLRLRELRERQALGQLAQARRDLGETEAAVLAWEQAYADRPQPSDGVARTAAELWSLARQGNGALERVAEAEAVREAAEVQVTRRMTEWQHRSIELSSVERLEERARLAEEFEAARKAAKELDELVVLQQKGGAE